MIRIGVAGTGVMGSAHARYLTDEVPGARVTAIADIDLDRARRLADQLGGGVISFADPGELFASEAIDAVVIATPDEFHVEHLRLVVQRGIPVLCEKPIAVTVTDARAVAEDVVAAETQHGRPLVHFGFMRRFDPGYRRMRDLVSSGEYGRALFARAITRNVASPGVTTHGLFSNIAVHEFDTFGWMLGSDWAQVQAHPTLPSRRSPAGLVDPLVFTARMTSGLLLLADIVAFNTYGYDVRAEVVCEGASIEMGIHGDVIVRAQNSSGVLAGGAMDDNWVPRFRAAYVAELRAWVESIATATVDRDLATSADALAATEACALGTASL